MYNNFVLFRPTTIDISKETLPKSENNLHLVILGSNDLTEKFSTKLKVNAIILFILYTNINNFIIIFSEFT